MSNDNGLIKVEPITAREVEDILGGGLKDIAEIILSIAWVDEEDKLGNRPLAFLLTELDDNIFNDLQAFVSVMARFKK